MNAFAPASPASSRNALVIILGLSLLILGFLFWLIYFREGAENTPTWIYDLPALNSLFNTISACCVVAGIVCIKTGRRKGHILSMIGALAASALFLVSYIVYHHYAGNTPFPKDEPIRPYYLFILASHIILSGLVVPLILSTVWFALTKQFQRHRKVARWTYPIWLYVSVTGVVVFFMLKHYVPDHRGTTEPLQPALEQVDPA